MDYVRIFDTTLRDGEQAPGASLDPDGKLEIARQLVRMGVDIIEAGFPVSSPGDFESVLRISKDVAGAVICGLSRCVVKDIDAASQALQPAKQKRIHLFIATSPIHMQYKLKKTEDEVIEIAREAIRYAKKSFDDIQFSPEDASRSEPEFLYKFLEMVIKEGATTVNIPDTVGYAIPEEFAHLIEGILNNVPNINKAVISVHCHNDLGLAVANSLAAVKAGARQIECTVNGIGERAGNASMEEVVMALNVRNDYFGIKSRINTKEIIRASRLVSKLTGFVVAPNKAIVGKNAFRHESGIHQDGMLKHKQTYEIMRPEDVGLEESDLVLGKHSGRHALVKRLEKLGFQLEEEKISAVFEAFKRLADRKKEVFDDDLLELVADQMRSGIGKWQLVYVKTSVDTTKDMQDAEVCLSFEGKEEIGRAQGDGPVDACYKAIEKITGVYGRLVSYHISSITAGKDAMGEVAISVAFDKDVVVNASASSTDIIEASVKAYLNALNRFNKKGGINGKA